MISRREFFKGAATVAAASAVPLHLRALAVEPRRAATRPSGPIHLDSNENAYGAFPSVLAMGNPLEECNRYPYAAGEVAEAIAAKHRVDSERVLLGCGSTETLKLCVSAFTSAERPLVMAYPSYEACEIHARANSAPVKHVALRSDYSHDVDAMLAAAAGGGLIYVCNPNNPTGTLTARKQLEQMIAKLPQNTYVLMDEAYHDFVPTDADYRSFLEAPIEDPRLIVARTFSKVYGMAGLRLGYGVAHPQTIAKMRVQCQTDSVNNVALHCATAALQDEAARRHSAERNAADRDEFMRQVAARKLQAIPSVTNFIMVDAKRPVRDVIAYFRQNNIHVGRPFPPYDTHVRVSLGRPQEMQAFWRTWDTM